MLKPIDVAKFLAECRSFWAAYSNAPVEVQNDMLDQRNAMLLRMDKLGDDFADMAALKRQEDRRKAEAAKREGMASQMEVDLMVASVKSSL